MALPPEPSVELTCTREIDHVVYVVPADLGALLVGQTCPKCNLGILELREVGTAGHPAPRFRFPRYERSAKRSGEAE
jgi:hypothetical protein